MEHRIDVIRIAQAHLAAFSARDRAILVNAMNRNLVHEPGVVTRNRKPLQDNDLASWELRVGAFRVYYEIVNDPEPLVRVLAFGVKKHAEVWIGGERHEI